MISDQHPSMVSTSLTVNAMFSIGITCICMLTLEARSLEHESDLPELIAADITRDQLNVLNGIHNIDDFTKSKKEGMCNLE